MTTFHHFTTIVPLHIPEQLKTLETWHHAHGCPIYTLNHSREFEVIRGQVPDWIVPIERRFPQCYGRDYLPFTELLATIRDLVNAPEDRVLLVNSDISIEDPTVLKLIDDPEVDLFFASRLDVAANGTPKGRYKYGYDVFSLKRSAAQILDMPEFYMGIPWWDYVLPLSAVTEGYRVRRLDLDAFHHVLHPQRWSSVSFDYIGWRCMQRLLPKDITAGAPSHERVQKFSEVTNQFLNSKLTAEEPLSPEESRAILLKRISSTPGIRGRQPAKTSEAHQSPTEGMSETAIQQVSEKAKPEFDPALNAAFQDLLDQIADLKTAQPQMAHAGHLDLCPDLWLSCDPGGQAEMGLAGQGDAIEMKLTAGHSGVWACLGIRLNPKLMYGWKYLGLLIETQSNADVKFTPTLRYYPAEAPLVDVPTAEPVMFTAGLHTHMAHIPLDPDLLKSSGSGELNLFFHSDNMQIKVLRLEPLLIG